MEEEIIISDIHKPTKIHLSYALGSFFDDFIATVLSTWVFKFYETEVFLPIFFITLGIVIYGIWNAFNDPLAGHISGYSFNFMKKYGKRFTWFIMAAIPCSIVYFLIYIPPSNNLLAFVYLILILCIFDTLFSFTIINWQGIFPDKFRSQTERTKVAGLQILCSLFGLALGILLPTMIITSGPPGTNIDSYVLVMGMVSIICLIVVILMIPGMRESRKMIKRTIQDEDNDKGSDKSGDKESYFQKIKFGLRQKNFISYLFAYLGQTVVMALMLASLPYWLQYILNIDDAFAETIILLSFLLAAVASSPLWIRIARKYGNRIGYMCGTGGTAASLTITLFISMFTPNFFAIMVGIALIGFSMGATWTLIYATFSDVIDEIVVKSKKRDEGVFYGFRTFFGRLSIVIQALTFGIIHPLTNFNPRALNQPVEALWGISIGMFVVPSVFYFIGFLFMWKVYDLKPQKVEKIKKQLVELNI